MRVVNIKLGVDLSSWAVPIHIEACRPYMDKAGEKWEKLLIVRLLCFYLDIRWY